MKPTKLREPENGTQKKISAFFKRPGTEQPSSKLFSSIGVSSLRKKDNLPEMLNKSSTRRNPASCCGSSERLSGPSTTCSFSNYSEGKRELVCRSNSENQCLTVLKDVDATHAVAHSTPQKSVQDSTDMLCSPEILIIPDTPEDRLYKSKTALKAIAISRSFLRPVSLLTSMPGKKTVPPKSKVKRVFKKPAGIVSIEFREHGAGILSKTLEGGHGISKSLEEKGQQSVSCICSTDSSFKGQFNTITALEVNLDQQNITENIKETYDDSASLNLCPETGFEEHLVNNEKQASTPEKLYSDGKNTKRMAKSGISPVAKRNTGGRIEEGCGSSRVIKAKRQLIAMAGFTDMKEMDNCVNSYQISGSSKASTKEASISCKDDNILVELLEELTPFPMVPQSISTKEKHAQTAADSRQLCSVSGHKEKENKSLQSVAATVNANGKPNKNLLNMGLELAQEQEHHETMLPKSSLESPSDGCLVSLKRYSTNSDISSSHMPGQNISVLSDVLTDVEMKYFELNGDALSLPPVSMQEPASRDANAYKIVTHLTSSKSKKHGTQEKAAEKSSSRSFTELWNRFTVCAVSRDPHYDLHLELAKAEDKEVKYKCILQEFWSDTHVQPGDIVNILGDRGQSVANERNVMIVNNSSGQIVVNPDLLLSGTTIVSGVHCLRRSVLNEKFKGLDGKNNHMLYGSIIHSLFQEAVKNQILNRDDIMSTAEMIVQSPKFLHEMYGQGVRESQVLCEVQSYIEPLQTWQKQHVDVTDNCQSYCRPVSEVSVVKIHDIEETIWSPRYGIKGKIDMTVEVKLGKKPGQVIRKVLPLELKTGKASYSVEHKGQVTLYSLMTSDRRDDPEEGLLLYLKQPDMKVIPVKAENKQGLLQLRNEMAHYLSCQTIKTVEDDGHTSYRIGHLPNPIDNLRSCSKCPQLLTCTIFQRSVEEIQLAEDHAMRKLLPDTLAHLSSTHLHYFTHWFLCMELEQAESSQKGISGIWCLSSAEREHQGDCLQQMVISSTVLGVPESQSFTEGKGCCVRFQRRPGFSGCAINNVGINKNDSVVISSEDGRLIALSTGFIKDVTEDAVDIVVDRDSFHDNKEFRTEVFRIDRCDTYNTANYLMSNLARLMESNPHSEKLRSLVIDRKKPEFSLTLSKAAVGRVKKMFQPLNKPQKTAILKVLMCKDYALIKGYPGTGKTSTIVSLVKILKELGHSVLLTSYTHSAVDNILLKLKEDNVPFLRLGRSSRVHPHLQNFVAENLTLNIKSVSELKEFYNSYAVVATSCLGINHPVFQQRKFDICIVDEASQILQPACLGPLFHAERFILVGDLHQLPPVVQSTEARSLGMEESLFSRLDGSGATYELCLQYRMNSTILQLANDLVYNGALQCGSPAVACATVHVPVPLTNTPEWMKVVLDPSLAKAVVFLDTRQMSAPEISDGQGFWNKVEASIIVHVCHLFQQAGVRAKDVGVIAPYRTQVQHLRRLASQQRPLRALEINTVDQYQGRDKALILVSFVRSCAGGGSVGKSGLLQDVRRLNVALTRAKHKLVLVGNTQTLSQYQPLRTLLNSLQERQQIICLPVDAGFSSPARHYDKA